jgi:AraC-like DNA-binding protein
MPFPFAAFSWHLPVTKQSILKYFQPGGKRMSREILWQICHKKDLNNGEVTRYIMRLLQEQGITTKQVASKLNIPSERVRNWYYRDTGMTALDLLRMMQMYQFVRQAVESSLSPEFR